MNNHFKLKAISVAIMASFITSPYAIGAEEVKTTEDVAQSINEKDNLDEIEVIQVTGFKGSLRKAMNAKRFSDGVSDSIHAEDVGKSTDQNIADALSRVTGVTVQEEGGEGTRISVRGAGPSMNQISMNGVALTGGLNGDGSDSTVADNSVDLSSFSSDILASIDVLKTAAADQDEGSLGASVILRTVRPLNLNKPRRTITAEGRYDDFSDENTGRFSGSFSDKFFDDTFGVIITATTETSKTRQDRITTDFYEFATPIADAITGDPTGLSVRRAVDTSGKSIRILGEGQTVDDLVGWDPATQVAHEGELWMLERENTVIGMNLSERKRESLSMGFQFRPTDVTDIMLDLTYSNQNVETDNHSIQLGFAPGVPLIHSTDLLEWNVADIGSNTLQKSLSRSNNGSLRRGAGEREVENKVASLSIEHEITDDFTMSVTAGYSKTTDNTPDSDEDGRYISLNTQTWGGTTRSIVESLDASNPNVVIEPVGYGCDQGSQKECSYFTGLAMAEFDALDGTVSNASSRFNPLDLSGNHLGGLTLRDNKQSDTNQSLMVDFDWHLDFEHVTGIEFGAKYSNRKKEVNIQNHVVSTGASLVDENNGNTDFQLEGFGSVNLNDMMSGKAFPYDDFADGIIDDRSNPFFYGWPMLSGERALQAITNREVGSIGFREDANGTREMETETKAAYVKVNFEFFDGRLTGNIGTRYVKDESSASGVGGINYTKFPQLVDPYNLLVTRNLGDIANQNACPQAIAGNDYGTDNQNRQNVAANDADLSGCYAWQVTHAYNTTESSTIPVDDNGNWIIPGEGGSTGPDVNRLVWGEDGNVSQLPLGSHVLGSDGVLYPTSQRQNRDFGTSGVFWPFIDRSTSFANGQTSRDDPRANIRSATVSNTGSSDIWLPSLNLNYKINDEMIGRLGLSKTMTRPRFDSLNPRTQIREVQWGPSTGSAGNTNLQPLESKNIDLSYEWYFNESSLVSVALFYKDMKNFERTVQTPFHYKDVRTEYDLASADLLLPFDETREVGDEDDCMPFRQSAGFFSEFLIQCDVVNVDIVKNGQGSEIKGVELGYTQNYDFLPGFLSGLGLSMNYTYQESDSESEAIGESGLFTVPLPQPYTPSHSLNTTAFYEKDGLMLRFAHRWTSDQLVNSDRLGGATWQEAAGRLDFSSSYQLTENFMVTFQATNLTDETRRVYYTASDTFGQYTNNSFTEEAVLDEGNALDHNVTNERTVAVYRTGRQFRLGVRANF